jgi:hypothetical protein
MIRYGLILIVVVLFGCATAITDDQLVALENNAWAPSREQLKESFLKLKNAVRRKARESGRRLEAWDSYKFQYRGIIQGTKKLIYINAFCQDFWKSDYSWEKSEVLVLDGGGCFFQAYYDVEAKKCTSITINGET